ncbi:hypothetical protein Bbelb_050280 [Branchiostoma belcheri]|nr:hypothetical protein Bbelb_050280 [Branchiostoma belcheri]
MLYPDEDLRDHQADVPGEHARLPASEAGAAGGGGPEAGAAGGGGSGDATGSTVSEDPAAAADVDDAPPEGEGTAKKQKLTGRLVSRANMAAAPSLLKLRDEFLTWAEFKEALDNL